MKFIYDILFIIIISSLPIILRHFIINKININERLNNVFMWFTIIFSIILIITIIMSNYNIYWRGYKSTTYLLITTNIVGIIYYITDKKILRKSSNKILLSLFLFLGIAISTLICLESFNNYKSKKYYNNKKYRIENTFNGIISMYRLPNLFVKNGIIEKRYNLKYTENEGEVFFKEDINDIKITTTDEGYKVVFILKKGIILTTRTR